MSATLTTKNKIGFVDATIRKPNPADPKYNMDKLQHHDLVIDLEFGSKKNCNKYYLH